MTLAENAGRIFPPTACSMRLVSFKCPSFRGGRMGASVQIYWPGITKEQLEGDSGFFNDDPAWANWIVELTGDGKLMSLMRS